MKFLKLNYLKFFVSCCLILLSVVCILHLIWGLCRSKERRNKTVYNTSSHDTKISNWKDEKIKNLMSKINERRALTSIYANNIDWALNLWSPSRVPFSHFSCCKTFLLVLAIRKLQLTALSDSKIFNYQNSILWFLNWNYCITFPKITAFFESHKRVQQFHEHHQYRRRHYYSFPTLQFINCRLFILCCRNNTPNNKQSLYFQEVSILAQNENRFSPSLLDFTHPLICFYIAIFFNINTV